MERTIQPGAWAGAGWERGRQPCLGEDDLDLCIRRFKHTHSRTNTNNISNLLVDLDTGRRALHIITTGTFAFVLAAKNQVGYPYVSWLVSGQSFRPVHKPAHEAVLGGHCTGIGQLKPSLARVYYEARIGLFSTWARIWSARRSRGRGGRVSRPRGSRGDLLAESPTRYKTNTDPSQKPKQAKTKILHQPQLIPHTLAKRKTAWCK